MTKAKTKGAWLRIRKAGGRPKKPGPRENGGRPQRPTTAERAEDATRTAAQARLMRLGYPDTPEGRKAALSPLCGDPLGMCIVALRPSAREQLDLWGIWQDISAAKRNWQQRVTGTNPNPQAAAIAMLPEPMQTDDAHSVDLRTAEERDEAAKRRWYYWLDLLMELPPDQRRALRGHLDGFALPIWDDDDHRPTATGAAAVRALDNLHEMAT
jgi:hypothetical protein